MKIQSVILYAAAGLAGWGGMAWWDRAFEADKPHDDRASAAALPSLDQVSAKTALQFIRRPAAGSAELSRIADLIAGVPDDSISDALTHVETWPPGTARAFATALLDEGAPWVKYPSEDTSSTVGQESKPPYNRYRELAAVMATGDVMPGLGLHRGTYHDLATLEDWVSLDPAAATAAVLSMPPEGSRSAAVDTAVRFLAKTDPAAALDFYFKSGDKNMGGGTADAWMKLVLKDGRSTGGVDAQRQFLDRMSRAQHDSLFEEITDSLQGRDVSAPLPHNDLNLLARCVLQTGESTPGMESFFEELTDYPHAAEEVRQFIESCNILSPAHEKALEILWAQKVESVAASGLDAAGYIRGDYFDSYSIRADHQALLDRVAPSLVSNLARTGRLPEALQLLDRIRDPDAHRTCLEAVLPSWMDADPAAAGAAFNAAPLTALERERWQRHPAFLLHP